MNSRRLARLMEIICDIKAHPRRTPEDMCSRLEVSRRQFYKDRDDLLAMGFNFHFSRRDGGFVLDKETTFSAQGLSLAELFSLVAGARSLARGNSFAVALGALEGLRKVVAQLPDQVQGLFSDVVDELVVEEGFNCRPKVLTALTEAVAQGRRVVLVKNADGSEERATVDPEDLVLTAEGLKLKVTGDGGLADLGEVSRVILTAFFSPLA